MKIRFIIQLIAFLLPWSARRYLLSNWLNFRIDRSARIGYSIILADRVILEANAKIGHLTMCKNIDSLWIGDNSSIGSLNFITGFNSRSGEYSHVLNRESFLYLGRHSAITSRHFLDCNGGVTIGDFTTLAGIRSTILSHSIDIYLNRQDVKPINIGNYCFIGSGVLILGGTTIRNYSVVAAGAVVNRTIDEEYILIGGVPGVKIKDLKDSPVSYFTREKGFVK